jgi:hypothetical protein
MNNDGFLDLAGVNHVDGALLKARKPSLGVRSTVLLVGLDIGDEWIQHGDNDPGEVFLTFTE